MHIDLIIEQADVLTMDPSRPSASRVGVLAGRVVGLDEELDGVTAEQTVDAQGATLLPGFIDAHTHLQFTGQGMSAVDLAGQGSVEAALGTIAAAAQHAGPEAWIEVVGYDQRVLGRHLTAQELDRAGGGRRVWARHISSHAAVVSTSVLDGITDRAVLAIPGVAEGLLLESAQEHVRAQRIPYPVQDVAGFVERAGRAARAEGITFCMEAGNGGFLSLSGIDLASYITLVEQGRMPVRMQVMPTSDVLHPVATNAQDTFSRGLDLGLRTGFGGDLLTLGAQKVMLDGGMMVQAARLTEPYVGSGGAGRWQDDPEAMRHAIVDGHAAGWQMAVHAIGDLAVDLAIEAFREAQQRHPRPGARHRIEHGGAIRPDQIPALAELGLAVVTQPSFIYDSVSDFADMLGPDRAPWLYRGRSLLDAGVRLVGSTDRPLPGSPLRAIQSFVDRTSKNGRVLGADEAITVREALELFTVHGAWVAGLENCLGRVSRGYLADLCLLGANPLTVPTEQIAEIPVLATAVGGELAWS
ncbi:amidohydrolase [Actinotalea sp. BY-33]|uniref:Amidohydrolase n=1 Tax=Actinotalea soli TaxID=2819234 RepID=A0A939LQF8_9CELL|nr:amidohydrolase [Actinotalea soli]MBO1751115.1 amidohydrolase [Actinotalea soli]